MQTAFDPACLRSPGTVERRAGVGGCSQKQPSAKLSLRGAGSGRNINSYSDLKRANKKGAIGNDGVGAEVGGLGAQTLHLL